MARIPTKRVVVTFYTPDGRTFVLNGDQSRRQFEVECAYNLDVSPQPNDASLVVLNMPEDMMHALSEATDASLVRPNVTQVLPGPGSKQQRITLASGRAYAVVEAGEDDAVSRVFEGSIEAFESDWDSGTWTTSLALADGMATASGSSIIVAFPKGVTLFEVVSYVIGQMGLDSTGNLTEQALLEAVGANYKSVLPRGFHITASGAWILNEIFRLTGAEWWTLAGEFFVVRKGQPTAPDEILVTERRGGLRKDPRPSDRSSRIVVSDFDSRLRPGRVTRVDWRGSSSAYRCDYVSGVVNNRAGDFAVEALLRAIPK